MHPPTFREPAPAVPTVERLGPLVREVRVSRTEATRMIVGAVFFAILAAGFLALFALALLEDGPGLGLVGTVGCVLLAGILVFFAYASVAQAARYLGSSLVLHANGFVFRQRNRSIPLVWEDIARWTMNVVHVQVGGVRARTARSFTLTTTDGQRLRLIGAYEHAAEHFAWIEDELTRQKLPGVIASLDAGMPVVFGPFIVDRDRIACRERRVPWTEVHDVAVDGRFVVVRTDAKPLRVAYATMASAPLFLAVVERLRARVTPRALGKNEDGAK